MPQTASRVPRLAAADWVDAACLAIAEGGVAAVAVEPLAKRLGVTKGSFYWHFPHRAALLEAALARWEAEETERVIAVLAKIDDPRQRLARLIEIAFAEHELLADADRTAPGLGLAFTLAVSDAIDDPLVAPVVRRVAERRIAYLEAEFAALGLAPAAARHRAFLAYAAYLGTLRLAREAPARLPRGADLRAYLDHVVATLVPPANRDAR